MAFLVVMEIPIVSTSLVAISTGLQGFHSLSWVLYSCTSQQRFTLFSLLALADVTVTT